MDFKTTLIDLYHLLILADNNVNEKELEFGKEMLKIEQISETKYTERMELLKTKNTTIVYDDCIQSLRKLDRPSRIRCMAWLSAIANADGFMDKEEWVLIYKIYHTELDLPLDEIMKLQKELNMTITGKSSPTMGIRVNK